MIPMVSGTSMKFFSSIENLLFVFSDPYVEVQLCPRYLYPHLEKQQTPIIKKTLNPQFNEKFEL